MRCRSCGEKKTLSLFSFGKMPLANRLLKKEQLNEFEPRYNLEIILCQACSLVQLKDIVPPEEMFNNYLYFSSNSDTMLLSVKCITEKIIPTLPQQATVIEIASNDGYLLQHYQNKNLNLLGIEPAKNIAEYAIQKGIPTRTEYFTTHLAKRLVEEGLKADIIHANNVMAHIPDINDFALGIKTLLKPNGQAIIEVPYVVNLINHCEFDTIYHEHVFYFSLLALAALFERHDLVIADVEEIPIHGGSLRLFITHATNNVISESVMKLLKQEMNIGIHKPEFYLNFSMKINKLKNELIELLKSLKNKGQKIAAYGASAKGSTLLNFFNVKENLIDFIVDRSPVKQGYYMSGTHIPIYSPDHLIKENVNYTLLLTWNFAKEILSQQEEYRSKGGQFIIPIPNLEVV